MIVNYCGHCGAAAKPNVRFCRVCGIDLGFTESPSIQVPLPSPPSPQLAAKPKESLAQEHMHAVKKPNPNIRKTSGKLAVAPATRAITIPLERQPGAASALAQASGLESASAHSSRIRKVLISLAVLLVIGASLSYYRQSLTLLQSDKLDRNLVTPEEQSRQLINSGEVAYEQGQYETAIAQFQQALALTPDHFPVYMLLAQSYQATGQLEAALKTYEALLQRDGQNLDARWHIAEIQRARGNWRGAYQEYQRIIAINPQSAQAVAALAMIEDSQDQQLYAPRTDAINPKIAIDHGMASLLPVVSDNRLPLAMSPSQLQGSSAPPALWSRSPGGDRRDVRALAEAHKSLGMRYHNVREFFAAIKEFSAAQRLNPDDEDLHYLIGSSYDGLGQDAIAHKYYKQCNSGLYVQVARSGAQKTAKAARAAKEVLSAED